MTSGVVLVRIRSKQHTTPDFTKQATPAT